VELTIIFKPKEEPVQQGMKTPSGTLIISPYRAFNLRDVHDEAEFLSVRKAVFILFLLIFLVTIFMHAHEQIAFLDALYFCVVTLTTVGYGEIVPKTEVGKFVVSCFIIVGIGLIGAALTIISTWITQNREKEEDVAKAQKSALETARLSDYKDQKQQEKEKDKEREKVGSKKKASTAIEMNQSNMHDFHELSDGNDGHDHGELAENDLTKSKKMTHSDSFFAKLPTSLSFASITPTTPANFKENIQSLFLGPTGKAVLFFLFNLFLGAMVFCLIQETDFVDGFYFSCVTVTTVGFGDEVFTTNGGKVFAIFWIIIATVAMARMLSQVIDAKAAAIEELYAERKNRRLLLKKNRFLYS